MMPASRQVVARAQGGTTGRPLRLQRKCACGAVSTTDDKCDECKSKSLQRKIAVSTSNDPAPHGGRKPPPHSDFSAVSVHAPAQPGSATPAGNERQRRADAEEGRHDQLISQSVDSALGNPGRPLDAPLRRFMEARFHHDFGGVRLHTDSAADASASAVNAAAYTVGRDIVFARSRYAPYTPQGLHLVAHELTHVVQQQRSPMPTQAGLRIESATSAAEVEAERTADAVLAPGPLRASPSARPTGLSRSLGAAVLGGIGGAVAGGLLGAIAGPAGAVLGALAGAALGAWIGGSASNSKTDTREGSPRQRIHRLLTRSLTDWVITDEEALQALAILQAVEKTDPVGLFDIVLMMKMSGEWLTLIKELPPGMRPSVVYYDSSACHPDRGYIMPGDRIHLEFSIPGSPEPGKGKPQSIEQQMSVDYDVGPKGVTLPYMGDVPIVGKSLQDAATQIAQAFADPLWAYEMSVALTPVKRGAKYAGLGEVSAPETARGTATTTDTKSLAQRDKRAKFLDLVPWSLTAGGRRLELAVSIYHREVDQHLDQYTDPAALWKWAQEQAEQRIAESEKKTPAQEFISFGQERMAHASTEPPEEQKRTRETYSRYMAWLGKHSEDPNLATIKPMDIWVKAYLNTVTEEVTASTQKAMAQLKEKREDAAWKKAELKFGDALTFAQKRIWSGTPTQSITLKEEQLSEETGEPVKIGYLIEASPAERIIRDKIASDFLRSMLDRMQKDPESFIKTTVQQDFVAYMDKNPEQLQALALTSSHPHVERQEDKVDIPAWQMATEMIIGLIPFVGSAVSIAEIVTGRDLSGHPLTTTEKTILGIGILLPGIFKALKLGKEAFVASRVIKEYGLGGAEASRVWKIYTGLGPGTTGARLFEQGLKDIKAGRAIDDPKVLQDMETVLKDLGMTDKETAKALLPGVERQAQAVAKEEVQAVKAVAGPISEETEKLLLNNPELREALGKNSLAATVLKKCASPCFPEQATAAQVKRLEEILAKIKKTGPYNEDALRTFLYNRRAELDKAIADINISASSKNLADGSASSKLNAWLDFHNSTQTVTKGVDPALIQAQKSLAHDVGVLGGRKQAGVEGLVLSDFDTPFKSGGFGQGFDDIAMKGKNWEKDFLYVIVEHKGGSSKLAPGQMDIEWVVGNIQRLYREGGPEGRAWAQRLAKALEEGRLAGKTYTTAVEKGGVPGLTTTIEHTYAPRKVKLGP